MFISRVWVSFGEFGIWGLGFAVCGLEKPVVSPSLVIIPVLRWCFFWVFQSLTLTQRKNSKTSQIVRALFRKSCFGQTELDPGAPPPPTRPDCPPPLLLPPPPRQKRPGIRVKGLGFRVNRNGFPLPPPIRPALALCEVGYIFLVPPKGHQVYTLTNI